MHTDFDQRWEELAAEILSGMKEWLLQHPRATLNEIEAALDERLGDYERGCWRMPPWRVRRLIGVGKRRATVVPPVWPTDGATWTGHPCGTYRPMGGAAAEAEAEATVCTLSILWE